MRVIRLGDLTGTAADVRCPHGGFVSLRGILAGDRMGFSLHKTIIPPGPPQRWHYKHHQEACYCVSGSGLLTDNSTGMQWVITPDNLYVLDDFRPHTFQAIVEVVLISVFSPAVVGREVHQSDGSYPIIEAGNPAQENG